MASLTDEYHSLHDNAPSNIIRVPLDIDTISFAIDKFEDCYTNDGGGANSIRVLDTTLEVYFNEISLVPAEERTRSIMAASFISFTHRLSRVTKRLYLDRWFNRSVRNCATVAHDIIIKMRESSTS